MKYKGVILLIIFLTLPQLILAQREFIRWNTFDVNKLHTKFSNANELCNGNFQNTIFAMPPAFEYPAGSGINYGTDVAFIIGGFQEDAGGLNPENKVCVEAGMTEGPADYWDPNHFDPYEDFVSGDRAAMSDDPESWPSGGFPEYLPDYYYKTTQDYEGRISTTSPGLAQIPVLKDSTGWPGAGPNGERIAEQESYSVCYAIDHLAEAPPERWLAVQTITRGMAWSGKYYEDFIVWKFVVRNVGHTPIERAYVAVWSDYSFIASFNPPNSWGDDGDRCYYDRERQFAYTWDIDGYETSPTGGTMNAQDIAWAGTIVLKTPASDEGGELGVTGYDAISNYNAQTTNIGNGARKVEFYSYNLANNNDPRDTDGDGIDDTFDGKDYFEADSEPLQIMSAGPFTLEPGELDTMLIATVFGVSKLDLFKNVAQVQQLYKDNWKVIAPPPKPNLQVIKGDQKVELFWDRKAETDSLFEGYRIYKSVDNGVSWGLPIRDIYGDVIAFKPLEIFDLKDGITGTNPLVPGFNLGNDSGLEALRKVIDGDTVNYFVDNQVRNGYKYRYAVTSYTRGGPVKPPIENSIATNPHIAGDNTVEIIPNAPMAKNTLDSVRVVPNPYIVRAEWEMGLGEHRVDFTNLPQSCTIRIYTNSGELVRILQHNSEVSTESWDLLSDGGQEAAPGLYFYHLSSALGEKMGKLVIVY